MNEDIFLPKFPGKMGGRERERQRDREDRKMGGLANLELFCLTRERGVWSQGERA